MAERSLAELRRQADAAHRARVSGNGAGPGPSLLLPHHLEDLRRSGLSDETITAAGIRSQSAANVEAVLRRKNVGAGLEFPYPALEGRPPFSRFKPDTPPFDKDGRSAKYLTAKGAGNRLYVPANLAPGVLEDAGVPLMFTEGEKKALKAAQEGFPCLGLAGVWCWKTKGPDGKSAPLPELDGIAWGRRTVHIAFDSDLTVKPDVTRAEAGLAGELGHRGADVRLVRLPSGPDGAKAGLDDFLVAEGAAGLRKLQEGALQPQAAPEPPAKPSQAQWLIDYARERAELWHTPQEEPYATITVGKHRETIPVLSRQLRDWLRRAHYDAQKRPPGAQAVLDAVDTLAAVALFDGSEQPVYVRVAPHGSAVYLDLADADWQAVEMTPAGWRLVAEPPVRFRRPRGMLALPAPVAGGSLENLRPYINVGGEDDWRLLVAWLVMTFSARGPYPVLILQGEQGSAKSTTARALRGVVDPSMAALRAAPREERDLVIAARNGWMLAWDNLSGIPPWMSDAICRLATGGGWGTRELFTDTDEVLIDVQRPALVNGIDELAGRDDLRDRSIILYLPPIAESARLEESELWAGYERARPRILGSLLDAASTALRRQDAVCLAAKPRMADFAKWVVAAEAALPWAEGEFLGAYATNRHEAVETSIEHDVVAHAVLDLVTGEQPWKGTAQELLAVLTGRVGETATKSRQWPQSARALSGRLRRAASSLRQAGVEVEWGKREGHQRRRILTLRFVGQPDQACK